MQPGTQGILVILEYLKPLKLLVSETLVPIQLFLELNKSIMRKCQVWVFRIFIKTELGFPNIKKTGFKKLPVSSGKNVDIITLLFIQKALAQLTQRT